MKKLVIVSPLPPTKSGIADYVYEQIPYLNKFYDIVCVVKSGKEKKLAQSLDDVKGLSILTADEFLNSEIQLHGENIIYHVGNNIHHEHCIDLCLKHPGIIVLHDYSLHHLVTELTLAKGDVEGYKRILSESHGELGEMIADRRNQGIYNELIPFMVPANLFLLKDAKGIIVHSNWSLMHVKVNIAGVPAVKIPMHYVDKDSSVDSLTRLEARSQLGIDKNLMVFSSIGFITPPKQIQLTLKALGKIKDELPDFKFILVGEPFDKHWLNNIIEENGLKEKVIVTGFVSLEDMHLYIASSDFSISLRYPSAGETSATLMRSIGKGVPSIIFNYASYSDFSSKVAFKIKLDTHNTLYLENAIKELCANQDKRNELGKNCLSVISTEHKVENVIAKYAHFIDSIFTS